MNVLVTSIALFVLSNKFGEIVANTAKLPIPRQCNTIAQFCVFCYDTEDIQTIHNLLPSLSGYTFYISPIEISCYGFRDGSFRDTPLTITSFPDTPIYYYEMKTVLSKGGVVVRSLIQDKNVQFISGDDAAPIFTILGDCITIDGIDMATTDESTQYRSPLIVSVGTDTYVRHSNAPILLQQIVDKTVTVEVTDSTGVVAINNSPDDILCYMTVSGDVSVISSMSDQTRLVIANTTPYEIKHLPGLRLELKNQTISTGSSVTEKCTGILSSPIIIVIIIVSTGIVVFFLDRFFSVSSTKEKNV